MNCKPNDVAVIVKSSRVINLVGLYVHVRSIAYVKEGVGPMWAIDPIRDPLGHNGVILVTVADKALKPLPGSDQPDEVEHVGEVKLKELV